MKISGPAPRGPRCAIERSGYALLLEAEIQSLRKRYASLSHREREVMNLVICGHLNKQIGGELGISEITVKAHRGKMMRKMQARSLADLVNMGAKRSDRPPGRDVPLRDRVTGRVQAQVGLFSP